jgi:hypothetical protein
MNLNSGGMDSVPALLGVGLPCAVVPLLGLLLLGGVLPLLRLLVDTIVMCLKPLPSVLCPRDQGKMMILLLSNILNLLLFSTPKTVVLQSLLAPGLYMVRDP